MRNKHILILVALCGALTLGGCNEDTNPINKDSVKVETPKVEQSGDTTDNKEETSQEISQEADAIDDPRNPPVTKLPKLESGDIRMTRPRLDRGDYRQSYVYYDGVYDSQYEQYKNTLSEVGFKDWKLIEDTEYYVMEASTNKDQEVVLTYFNSDEQRELEVRLIDSSRER